MKNFIQTIFFLLATTLFTSQATATEPMNGDTVVIEIDADTRIIIYTASKADLKSLESYDINKMIRDLNTSIREKNQSYMELDDRGDRYRMDTAIVYQQAERSSPMISGIELNETRRNKRYEDNEFRNYRNIKKPSKRTRNDFNIDLGTNNWMEEGVRFPNELNRPYSVRPWGSWFVGLNSVNRTYIAGPLNLDWGFGFNWYNWKLEDPGFVAVKTDTETIFAPVDPNFNAMKSKLTAGYLNFTMVPMLRFNEGGNRKYKNFHWGNTSGFRIGAGGYVGYRMMSRSKLVYNEGGSKEKDRVNNNFYLNNVRYGVRAQVGWKGVDIFANYDLNEVFVTDRGPRLNAVSFGIIL